MGKSIELWHEPWQYQDGKWTIKTINFSYRNQFVGKGNGEMGTMWKLWVKRWKIHVLSHRCRVHLARFIQLSRAGAAQSISVGNIGQTLHPHDEQKKKQRKKNEKLNKCYSILSHGSRYRGRSLGLCLLLSVGIVIKNIYYTLKPLLCYLWNESE